MIWFGGNYRESGTAVTGVDGFAQENSMAAIPKQKYNLGNTFNLNKIECSN